MNEETIEKDSVSTSGLPAVILKAVCFAGLMVVLAFGIQFGIFATQESDVSVSQKKRADIASLLRSQERFNKEAKLSDQAQLAFEEKNWNEAYRLYSAITEEFPRTGQAFYRKACCLQELGRIDEAIADFEKATVFSTEKTNSLYRLAIIYGSQLNKRKTLDYLDRAVKARYISPEGTLGEQPCFQFLKGDPEFIRLEQLSLPLAQRSIYRQFDFILGDWEVANSKDKSNKTKRTIRKHNSGYLLIEKISYPRGDEATGFHFVDPKDMRWKQNWIQGNGGILNYSGEFRDGEMRLTGVMSDDRGNIVHLRKVYIPIDHNLVNYKIESSKDGGKTWKLEFDGYWRRASIKRSEAKKERNTSAKR